MTIITYGTVQPGKCTTPPPGGGVHPPINQTTKSKPR